MDHEWHQKLHKLDRLLYFPQELSMVYRTSLLLRGLSLSLQINTSIAEKWRHHAQEAIDRNSVTQKSLVTKRHLTKSSRPVLGSPLMSAS
jgi:hypothetical protein